jgi:hypothetical protein
MSGSRVGALALCLFGLGCATEAASTAPPAWRLVGLYDSASLLALEQDETAAAPAAWQPHPGMVRSCGPVKHPDGLGMFEAEAVSAGETPALVVLLAAVNPRAQPLTSDGLVVLFNGEEGPQRLQPMVEPRRFELELGWDTTALPANEVPPEMKLIETQLRVELCMEHKTGRAWMGGSSEDVREAYLLDPPRARRAGGLSANALILGSDRRHYAGQRNPVPAMLGPSDACVSARNGVKTEASLKDVAAGSQRQAKGEGSLDLIPTDVWGAEVRACAASKGEAVGDAGYRMPWRLELSGGASPTVAKAVPERLDVGLRWREGDGRALVTLKLGDKELFQDRVLTTDDVGEASTGAPGAATESLLDLLAHVPLRYPTLSHPQDEDLVYTALIIPAWQLNELLGDTTVATGARSGAVLDGVGWALRHPERLSVLLATGEAGAGEWVNLASAAVGEGLRPRSWGYTVGHLYGRQPLLAVGVQEPRWASTLVARRADAQAMFLLSASVMLLVAGVGLTRVRDLWSGVPEERVTWWPTPPEPGGKAPEPPPEGEA